MSKDKWERNQYSPRFNRAAVSRKLPVNDRKRSVTKEELERHEARRARPQARLVNTPGGLTEQFVHERHDARNEKRISHLRERLARHHNKARDDFGRGRR